MKTLLVNKQNLWLLLFFASEIGSAKSVTEYSETYLDKFEQSAMRKFGLLSFEQDDI